MTNDGEADYHDSCPISMEELQSLLPRMVLVHRVMPTMCGAALHGMGMEPVLDCVPKYCECGHFCFGLSMWVYANGQYTRYRQGTNSVMEKMVNMQS